MDGLGLDMLPPPLLGEKVFKGVLLTRVVTRERLDLLRCPLGNVFGLQIKLFGPVFNRVAERRECLWPGTGGHKVVKFDPKCQVGSREAQ